MFGIEHDTTMKSKNLILIGTALGLSALAHSAGNPFDGASPDQSVVMNGRTVSNDARSVNGKAYVPLADVAKALGMVVVKTANGYKLVASGGANAIKSRAEGNVGDDLFTGQWRFMVKDLNTVQSYATAYTSDSYNVRPNGSNEKLIVLTCRVKNGTGKRELIQFQNSGGKADQAVLTVDGERAYRPVACDVHFDHYMYAAYALPGSAVDFRLVFSVPKTASPKSLVYQIFRYDDRGDTKKYTTVRVNFPK